MTVVYETLNGFVTWVQTDEDRRKPVLSGAALKTVSFVSKSSSFMRSLVSAYDSVYKLKAPLSLSALGFTSGFGIVTGALNLRKGIHDYKKRMQDEDVSGAVLGGMHATGGVLQMAGSAAFITIRSLSTLAHVTENKTAKAVAGIFGYIASGVSQAGALLSCASLLMEIYGSYAIIEECRDREPLDCLESLREKLQNRAERSALIRMTSEACVREIETVDPNNAEAVEAVIDRTYHESAQSMLSPMISLALMGLGIAASMIVTVTTAPTALLVATGINGCLAIFGFSTALISFIQALNKEEAPGRYDQALLATLSLGCLFSLGMTRMYHNSREAEVIIGALGLVWFVANAATYLKVKRMKTEGSNLEKRDRA